MVSLTALKERLVKDLSTLLGSSRIKLHVLLTPSRKCTSLFPHSSIPQKQRPKITQQDVLVLLSQAALDDDSSECFVSAVELALYTLDEGKASILYVSKVDSTGQSVPGSASPTPPLVKSLLGFFTDPETRPTPHLRIQLFARAQNQYLFPDSSQHPGKRVLTDKKLCRWWKDVLTEVASASSEKLKWDCFYLFPGLIKMEAEQMMRNATTKPPATGVEWFYGHPYLPSSSPFTNGDGVDIFDCIPTFDDDPKARFIVELVATDKPDSALPKSPARKKRKSNDGAEKEREKDDEKPVSRLSADEFWERMEFRQECSLGAVTGFFFVDSVSDVPIKEDDPNQPGLIPQPAMERILGSLMNHDFSATDKARHATQALTDTIKGLCSNLETTKPEEGEPTQNGEGGDSYTKYPPVVLDLHNPPWQQPSTQAEPVTAPAAVNVLQVRKKKRPAA